MPRLLIFAVCQKAIIDKGDNAVSLISLMSGLTFSDLPEGPVPADAVAQNSWAAVTVWERTEGDQEKTFEQLVRIVMPDGTEHGEGLLTFAIPERTHTNTVSGNGFPIGQEGLYQMRLFVREAGADEWGRVADYPIEVTYDLNR